MKLREWLEFKYGFGLSERERIKGDVPVYGSSGIVGWHNKPVVEGKGIIIGRKGNVGAIYFSNSSFYPIDTVYFVDSLKKEGDLKFFYYLLKTINFQKVDINVGVPGLNRDTAHSLEVFIPQDLNEQRRIAEILSAFDDKIELNNKVNKTLEEMAQAIFKEWFVDSEKLKVKSEKLSELVEPQYGYTETASDRKVGPKFLRVKDINKNDWIDWETVPYCRISKKDFKKYQLKKGDIVIARMADPGKVGIIEQEIEAVFASYLIRLKIKSEEIRPYYLYYYLKSLLYQNFIFGASTGTTRKSANAKVLTDCKIIIPEKSALEKFEKIASNIRLKINSNILENQRLSALRDLLLPKLMNGKIRMKA